MRRVFAAVVLVTALVFIFSVTSAENFSLSHKRAKTEIFSLFNEAVSIFH